MTGLRVCGATMAHSLGIDYLQPQSGQQPAAESQEPLDEQTRLMDHS